MKKFVIIKIERPEGYEDVDDFLVAEDFVAQPKAPDWNWSVVKDLSELN